MQSLVNELHSHAVRLDSLSLGRFPSNLVAVIATETDRVPQQRHGFLLLNSCALSLPLLACWTDGNHNHSTSARPPPPRPSPTRNENCDLSKQSSCSSYQKKGFLFSISILRSPLTVYRVVPGVCFPSVIGLSPFWMTRLSRFRNA